jgi:intracellular sulfur oxidation DsrE/DsrF family protein
VKRGVHFAVCDMASHRFAGVIARKIDGDADAIYKEMTANAIGNAHFVAAGIIAVNRAQERGYAMAYTG